MPTERKAVIFNLSDATEREMYELAQQINFSGEVKKFLAQRINRMKSMQTASSSITANLGDK